MSESAAPVITKNTLIPISLVLTLIALIVGGSVNISTRFVKIESEVSHQKSTDAIHTSRLLQLSTQFQQYQENSIRQEALLKNVERSLLKIEEKLK